MPKVTPEQFAQIVKAVADGREKVKLVQVANYTVLVDIISRSGKSAYPWSFMFDEATGTFEYRGAFANANEPVFFAEAIQKAIKGITGA